MTESESEVIKKHSSSRLGGSGTAVPREPTKSPPKNLPSKRRVVDDESENEYEPEPKKIKIKEEELKPQ